ncbi:MAG TPA: TM2 domain-containing protein [Dongiaceae bacterium]|nr:TM2 domain-containing protein [Dongiaceae bacterium]
MSYGPIESDREAYDRQLIENTVFNARKSGLTAYLLWLFLGIFGMHNFYLGRPQAGGLQMFGTLFVYCTYVSNDPWPLIGGGIGIPLGISFMVDLVKIPERVVACSERLRARLQDEMEDWRGA